MTTYTDQEIRYLITCPKKVLTFARKQLKSSDGHSRNDLRLSGPNGTSFSVFIRVSDVFIENFSIGLVIIAPDGTQTVLMRCNGDHGEHRNHVIDFAKFSGCHVHFATEEAFKREKSIENYAVPTKQYSSYPEALAHFIEFVNILEPEKCPALASAHQLKLV